MKVTKHKPKSTDPPEQLLPTETVPGDSVSRTETEPDPLKEARQQASEYLDALQRLKAEFDNYRKRMDKDRQRLAEIYQASVLSDLLPTLDAFDEAFKAKSDIPGKADILDDSFRSGIRLVYDGLVDVLQKLGLEKLNPAGHPFDPEIAEAMAVVPSVELPPDHVIQVITTGYRFKNRVLRPAKVIVSSQQPPSPETEPRAPGSGGMETGD
ncbi:nucleotide exchange factor GrpE [bacterium]|nr:nucleotide exchange factor GrpE [candidate division CSSED10-310 bacterium]